MSASNQGWTENEAIDWGDKSKAPPPPPPPGLYRCTVAKAEAAKVGKEHNPGVKMTLKLGAPFSGGDPVNVNVGASMAIKPENKHRFVQLCESFDVPLPSHNGTEALTEFCKLLCSAGGGIVKIAHGKDNRNGEDRAEVVWGRAYYTEAEAQAEVDGLDPAEAAVAPVQRKGRSAAK